MLYANPRLTKHFEDQTGSAQTSRIPKPPRNVTEMTAILLGFFGLPFAARRRKKKIFITSITDDRNVGIMGEFFEERGQTFTDRTASAGQGKGAQIADEVSKRQSR